MNAPAVRPVAYMSGMDITTHASTELVSLLAGPAPTERDVERARQSVAGCIRRYLDGDTGVARREGIGEYSLLAPHRMLDIIVVDLRTARVPGRRRQDLVLAMSAAEAIRIWTTGARP